ncbi:MAG: DUF2442 domain-containing protein [Betaproteobacteria bacterium]|nr:DUF2442 domain-containing protein [Betaproteobacteria bacterium]
MMHRITACRAESNYTLWIQFENGLEGRVYVGDLVGVGMFKAWEDVDLFEQVTIDPVATTLWWEGGVHLDSEVLYQDLANSAKLSVH